MMDDGAMCVLAILTFLMRFCCKTDGTSVQIIARLGSGPQPPSNGSNSMLLPHR